jgi:hypothetical protein
MYGCKTRSKFIPFILETERLLTALFRPNHLVNQAHGVSFICRRRAIQMILGISPYQNTKFAYIKLHICAAIIQFNRKMFYLH